MGYTLVYVGDCVSYVYLTKGQLGAMCPDFNTGALR